MAGFFVPQAVHTPLQTPKSYIYPYRDMANIARRKLAAMVSTVDEAVRNVTYALRKLGYYRNSVIVYSTDNGAQPFTGGSNWPLRGRKVENAPEDGSERGQRPGQIRPNWVCVSPGDVLGGRNPRRGLRPQPAAETPSPGVQGAAAHHRLVPHAGGSGWGEPEPGRQNRSFHNLLSSQPC